MTISSQPFHSFKDYFEAYRDLKKQLQHLRWEDNCTFAWLRQQADESWIIQAANNGFEIPETVTIVSVGGIHIPKVVTQ